MEPILFEWAKKERRQFLSAHERSCSNYTLRKSLMSMTSCTIVVDISSAWNTPIEMYFYSIIFYKNIFVSVCECFSNPRDKFVGFKNVLSLEVLLLWPFLNRPNDLIKSNTIIWKINLLLFIYFMYIYFSTTIPTNFDHEFQLIKYTNLLRKILNFIFYRRKPRSMIP